MSFNPEYKPPFNPDNALLIAADTWADLRPCDIGRLFDTYNAEDWPALYRRLIERRPELTERTHREVIAILGEAAPDYVADQPLDPPGYARRVAILEYLHGMTRGDAQGVADLEFQHAATAPEGRA